MPLEVRLEQIRFIGLWELNEAFACQALYCRDDLRIDSVIYNVNRGTIAIGYPYGVHGGASGGHASPRASAAERSM
ncbi:acetyl-CoA acetyltransferase [Bradyrhizobium sp. CIR18]|nr:acetyl-CoA acetyltransferase [Bradyrhizobium sp. CIR18]